MNRLKKIWLWISAGFAILFGLFVIIFKFIVPNQQRKGEFKKKNKELEKEKKEIDTKIVHTETEKAKIENDIKILESKIADEYHLLSEDDRKSAIETLNEFKRKYENE
tara:strand:+ start:14 stop:337 length:324 start_codon:yes stop_codon:yes gene_type:complete